MGTLEKSQSEGFNRIAAVLHSRTDSTPAGAGGTPANRSPSIASFTLPTVNIRATEEDDNLPILVKVHDAFVNLAEIGTKGVVVKAARELFKDGAAVGIKDWWLEIFRAKRLPNWTEICSEVPDIADVANKHELLHVKMLM